MNWSSILVLRCICYEEWSWKSSTIKSPTGILHFFAFSFLFFKFRLNVCMYVCQYNHEIYYIMPIDRYIYSRAFRSPGPPLSTSSIRHFFILWIIFDIRCTFTLHEFIWIFRFPTFSAFIPCSALPVPISYCLYCAFSTISILFLFHYIIFPSRGGKRCDLFQRICFLFRDLGCFFSAPLYKFGFGFIHAFI